MTSTVPNDWDFSSACEVLEGKEDIVDRRDTEKIPRFNSSNLKSNKIYTPKRGKKVTMVLREFN